MDDQDNQMSGTQTFLTNLFQTGANAFVDSQYAKNYEVNNPRPYNAGFPGGVSTGTSFAAFVNTPAAMVLGVGLLVVMVIVLKK